MCWTGRSCLGVVHPLKPITIELLVTPIARGAYLDRQRPTAASWGFSGFPTSLMKPMSFLGTTDLIHNANMRRGLRKHSGEMGQSMPEAWAKRRELISE